MTLDNNSPLPMYRQIVDLIQQDIAKGVLKAGDRLPTEHDLSEKYGVSRITVRNALADLVKKNVLIKKQGRGTFVSSEKFPKMLSIAQGFTDMCIAMNLKPGGKIIKSVFEDPTEEERRQLNLEADEKLITIERIRTINDEPIMVEISKFPESTFSFLLEEDLTDISLYALFRNKYGIVMEYSQKVIELVYASYELSKYLHVAKGTPLLCITSIVYTKDYSIMHSSKQLIIGDKFKLTL